VKVEGIHTKNHCNIHCLIKEDLDLYDFKSCGPDVCVGEKERLVILGKFCGYQHTQWHYTACLHAHEL